MFLSEIPGYSRAIERADRLEDHWRDWAFLGINEQLRPAGAGKAVEVKLLTLRMFVQLCAARSPFLVGGRVGPEHVAQILWRLSPGYESRQQKAESRKDFVESIALLPFTATVRSISRFLDRMLIDKPPSRGGDGNGTKADTSFAAALVHELGRAYGWSADQILDTPMPMLFQFLRKIQREHDPEMVRFNPLRDRLTGQLVQKALGK